MAGFILLVLKYKVGNAIEKRALKSGCILSSEGHFELKVSAVKRKTADSRRPRGEVEIIRVKFKSVNEL